jgi:hypothetical protein
MELRKTDSEEANVISLAQTRKGSTNILVNKQISLVSIELRLYARETFPIIQNNALCYHLSTRSASKSLTQRDCKYAIDRCYVSTEIQMSSVSPLKFTF